MNSSNPIESHLYPFNDPEYHKKPEPAPVMSTEVQNSLPIIFWVLVGVVILLAGVLLYLTVPSIIAYIKRRIPVDPEKKKRRYVTIESWLVSKRVREHDASCQQIVGTCSCDKTSTEDIEGDDRVIENKLSYDTVETAEGSCLEPEGKECPVCFEPFEVDQIVSWSPNTLKCRHVFHHNCIKEWLVYHTTCPFCRETYLPCDEPGIQLDGKTHSCLSRERRKQEHQSYFCATDGLVRISPEHSEAVRHDHPTLLASRVTKKDLVEMRGQNTALNATLPVVDEEMEEASASTSSHVSQIFRQRSSSPLSVSSQNSYESLAAPRLALSTTSSDDDERARTYMHSTYDRSNSTRLE